MLSDYVKLALSIATEAHKGQKDKAGIDYIQHPLHVASLVSSDEEKAVALLHDVMEDSSYTLEDLADMGIPQPVVEAVSILTKKDDISYYNYLDEVKQNELARAVKLADLKHNSDLTRINQPTVSDFKRTVKYEMAIEYLY